MSEIQKDQTAKPGGDSVFSQIMRKEIPSEFVYEDDKCIVLNSINPKAPVQFLVIPRKPITGISTAEEGDKEILGHLLLVAKKVAQQKKLDDGYRLIINDSDHGCQTVYHLHIHVMGGRQLRWPPG